MIREGKKNTIKESDYTLAEFEFLDNHFHLHPLKVMYWKEEESLIIADLHIGKSAHFRKNGIPLHANVNKNNFWNLSLVLDEFKPTNVIFLGDLFHSDLNQEWSDFVDFMANYPDVNLMLVKGNHDIIDESHFQELNMAVVDELEKGPFLFTHEPMEDWKGDLYNLSGHIHPAVRMSGKANQGMTLPCFYFSKNAGLLPSFGDFTGRYRIKPKKSDVVFVSGPNEVLRIL